MLRLGKGGRDGVSAALPVQFAPHDTYVAEGAMPVRVQKRGVAVQLALSQLARVRVEGAIDRVPP